MSACLPDILEQNLTKTCLRRVADLSTTENCVFHTWTFSILFKLSLSLSLYIYIILINYMKQNETHHGNLLIYLNTSHVLHQTCERNQRFLLDQGEDPFDGVAWPSQAFWWKPIITFPKMLQSKTVSYWNNDSRIIHQGYDMHLYYTFWRVSKKHRNMDPKHQSRFTMQQKNMGFGFTVIHQWFVPARTV